MSFYSRYELVKLVRNGEPKSFQAREIQTGRSVLLHLWGMGDESKRSPLLLRLRDQMKMDPAALMGAVIEVQEGAEPPYVVTAFDEQFTSLDQWIHAQLYPGEAPAAVAEPMPTPPPLPTAAPKAEPGEFTRLFQGSPLQSAPQPSPVKAEPAPAKAEPGEFTKLFDNPPAQPAASVPAWSEPPKPQAYPPPAPMTPPQPVVAPPAAHTPGEFTRMFGGPAAPPAPPASQPHFQPQPPIPAAIPQPQYRPLANEAPRPAAAQPPLYQPPAQPSPLQPPPAAPRSADGDFAKFFGSPLGANPLPVEEIERGKVAPPPSDPASRPFSGPSDFTIQFGREQPGGLSPDQPPSPPAHSPLQAGATGLFSMSDRQGTMPQAQAARPAGPSEFTRVLRGPHLQQSGEMAPAPPNSVPMPGGMPLAPPPRKSNVLGILVAVLSFLLILLLITVVVLIFKK